VLALFVPNLGIAGGGASMLVMVAIIGVVAAVAIPAYQDYTVRAKLLEPVSVGRQATVAVSEYYEKNNEVPARIEDAGFAPPKASSTIETVTIDKNGAIGVVLSIPQVKGKVLRFVPQLDADKRVVWRCSGGDIPAKFLPVDCRQSVAE
jgi:type II secretory pathway pseudopilin PulG